MTDASAMSSRLFEILEAYFAHSSKPAAKVCEKVSASYVFKLPSGTYLIDLSASPGRAAKITSPENETKADCVFTIKDEDFLMLAAGKLKAQQAFLSGKLKLKGSISTALKFSPEVFPKIPPSALKDTSRSASQIVNDLLASKM